MYTVFLRLWQLLTSFCLSLWSCYFSVIWQPPDYASLGWTLNWHYSWIGTSTLQGFWEDALKTHAAKIPGCVNGGTSNHFHTHADIGSKDPNAGLQKSWYYLGTELSIAKMSKIPYSFEYHAINADWDIIFVCISLNNLSYFNTVCEC